MKSILSIVTLAAVVEGAVFRRETGCCFHLTGNGGPGGEVDQLSDGQNRLGQNTGTEGQYCLNGDGGLTDSNGRGCIITAPTGQWQCDVGATPTPGFTVGSDGTLAHDGSTLFFTCPTGDNGGYNIYNQTLDGEPDCVPLTLTGDDCKATAPAPAPSPSPPASTCPADLPTGFEYPHLIIPVDSSKLKTCFGTSYNGSAYGTVSSIFNFDIPSTAKGKTCKLRFLFPEQSQLETSAYTYSGDGTFKFASLDGPASESATYASSPKVVSDLGTFELAPGNAYDIASSACPDNTAIAFWLQAVGDSVLDYFQDYNPCPIGLYIVVE